jgi:hypothetical protein
MKTNYFSSSKSTSFFYLILGFSMVLVSCGTYKNSTYYDRDGIYGSEDNETKRTEKNVDKYKDYFSALREKNEQEQVFTDVENYSSIQDTVNNKSEKTTSNYSGWGNNQQPINVTIYENNWGWNNYGYNSHWNYGWNWNLGWNSWYGPSIGYGWGWNNWYGPNFGYYGWGYNNYYHPYYGYYGYNGYYGNNWYYGYYDNPRYYSYSNGPRGGRVNGRVSGRYDFGRSGIASGRDNYSVGRRSNITNGTRNSDQISPRSYNSVRTNDANPRLEINNTRDYSPTRGELNSPRGGSETPRNYTPVRVETEYPRGESSSPRNNTPVRVESSYPRSESSSPRSYTPSPSYGGGNYGGGSYGGGGRSSGSGGGGRR